MKDYSDENEARLAAMSPEELERTMRGEKVAHAMMASVHGVLSDPDSHDMLNAIGVVLGAVFRNIADVHGPGAAAAEFGRWTQYTADHMVKVLLS